MIKKHERTEYEKLTLSEADILEDPYEFLERWWQDAIDAKVDLLDAVYLSTVDENNHPDARIVLLKSFDERGLVFFTNYHSQKAKQLEHNPHASLIIFWPKIERQIRIRGQVQKTTRIESEEYFSSRPHGAQIGAWASPQSEVIKSRKTLEQSFRGLEQHYQEGGVPCPPHWGGFRLVPNYFEFWQGRPNRLHDRFRFMLKDREHWLIARLAP